MSFPQNSTPANPGRAYAGMLEPTAPKYARSYAVEGDDVHAGAPVLYGTDRSAQVITAIGAGAITAEELAGFVVLDSARPQADTQIPEDAQVAVLRTGVMYLLAGATIEAGNEVFYTLATGVYTDTAGAGKARLPGCRWLESGASAAMVQAAIMLGGPAESEVEEAQFVMSYIVPADLTGTNAQAETYIGYAFDALTLVSAEIVPGGALTADATNNATLNAFKRTSAGASQTALASATTTAGDTGSWTAGAGEDMGVTVAAVAAGSSISISITKGGTGVTVPAGTAIVLTFTKD